jgi:hypothetical protein
MLDFEPGYHDQRVDLWDGDTLKDVTYGRWYDNGSVTVIEARSRQDALEGKGHIWWSDGTMRGPSVDPRQSALPFNHAKHR